MVSKDECDSWNALPGLLWDVTERGTDAVEAIQAPRRRYVTRADLRKYGVTIGCAACSDIAVHGKTAKPHTDECRAMIGVQVEHDPEGYAELHVEEARAPVVRANACHPTLLKQQHVGMPVEASVKRGADAAADDEERSRL